MAKDLDDAIFHAKKIAAQEDMCDECRIDHGQIVQWFNELRLAREIVGRIVHWSRTYGHELRPENTSSADTYGDGIRAAKHQVSRLLKRPS